VEDVVGYKTLGHCFFLEDGNELDNVFVHNLGLVTLPGSLLPSERDARMCLELSVGARRYQHAPDIDKHCMYALSLELLERLKLFMGNTSQSYLLHGITVLPATRHRWTCLALTPARQSVTYSGGMEGSVDFGSWLYWHFNGYFICDDILYAVKIVAIFTRYSTKVQNEFRACFKFPGGMFLPRIGKIG